MRLRDSLPLACVALCLLTAGCSRLTFVKPSMERGKSREVAPKYDIRDDKQARERLAARDQLTLAADSLQAGRVDEAEKQARKALSLGGDQAEANTMLALIATRKGDARAAGDYFERAARQSGGRGAEANNYGAWLCGNGREAEAQPWFDRALADADYPTPATALANAASCAFRIGQYGHVDEELRKALLLDPDNAVALETMAANQYRLGQYFDARAFVERRLAAAPATASVLQLAMQIESGLGDMAAARRYSQRLQTEFPPAANANPGAGKQ